MRQDAKELFPRAIQKNEIFDFLTGQKDYEIRLNVAYMPTDTDAVTFNIKKYLENNPNFDKKKLIDVFIKLSKDPEWSWLIVFYAYDFAYDGMNFLPIDLLYSNLEKNKEFLKKNQGWICFNFGSKFDNLWDIIVYKNNCYRKKGYKFPLLLE